MRVKWDFAQTREQPPGLHLDKVEKVTLAGKKAASAYVASNEREQVAGSQGEEGGSPFFG